MPRHELPEVTLRHLRSDNDYEACWQLQQEIWGLGMRDCVSPALLKVSQHVGGIAAGAFDGGGELLGFVWGISGFRDGRRAHWSHMLGIRPGARDAGLGARLKRFQRSALLELGVEEAYWTYDPLEARNAHLNFNRLGVEVEGYVRDQYGSGEGSTLHRGLGTDRFVVVWRLQGELTQAALAGRLPGDVSRVAELPVAHGGAGAGTAEPPGELDPLPEPPVRVEVPERIQDVKAEAPEVARGWRRMTRRCFEAYLDSGHRVSAFYRDRESGRCFYVVT